MKRAKHVRTIKDAKRSWEAKEQARREKVLERQYELPAPEPPPEDRNERRRWEAERKLTPQKVETAKAHIRMAILLSAIQTGVRKPPVHYVWFPEDRVTRRQLRKGNPPPDQDRPEHLKGYDLVVDVAEIPDDVWEAGKQFLASRTASTAPMSIQQLIREPTLAEQMRIMGRKGLVH